VRYSTGRRSDGGSAAAGALTPKRERPTAIEREKGMTLRSGVRTLVHVLVIDLVAERIEMVVV
jgi:hypothetical protein